MTAKPDWYSDPTNPKQLRWWDGENWTNRVSVREEKHIYPETDYRRHGQIKAEAESFIIENRKNSVSDQLNSSEIKPEIEKQPTSLNTDELISSTKAGRFNEFKEKAVRWLKSDSNLSTKKKIGLAIALIASLLITGSILFTTYQIENNFGKPTPYEQVDLKDATRNSPNIIDSRVTYNESRECEGFLFCENYRITASGSSIFNGDDYISFISSIAILKTSKTDIQVCFSDEDIKSELQKPAEHYAAIMDTSEITENSVEVYKGTACTVFSAEYLQEIADSF